MNAAHLRRIDETRNMHRFYRLEIAQGAGGQIKAERKRRRGYNGDDCETGKLIKC